MIIKVLYFAQIAEKVGFSSEEIEVSEGVKSDELLSTIKDMHPQIKELSFNLAVDQTLIKSAVELKNGIEVALLPPFAGG